jgi:hypothetical protein
MRLKNLCMAQYLCEEEAELFGQKHFDILSGHQIM